MGLLARGARKALVSAGRSAVARKVGPAVASRARPVAKSVVRASLAAGDGLRPLTTKVRRQWNGLVTEVRQEASESGKAKPAPAEGKARVSAPSAKGKAQPSGTSEDAESSNATK